MLNILGINISISNKQEILKKISGFLDGDKSRYIVTPNPEFLLEAKKDEEFFYILNKADIAIPDGVGLIFAGLFRGKKIKRISGIDLMYDICALAEKQNKSIFLLGGAGEVAHEAGKKLKILYPSLQIVGAESGLQAEEWQIEGGMWKKGESANKKLIAKIDKVKPDIIFVAFGQVKQEKWIHHAITPPPTPPIGKERGAMKLSSVKLMMGVGGSFDFIAGRIKRAPKIMRALGLEWAWRLLQEPFKRLPRIFKAVVVFPLVFFRWRFINPWLYRSNVACLLYKRENDNIKVLIAERRSPIGHWQLPQGGTDGEKLEIAGSRELREEVGTDKFKTVKVFKNLHKYRFGNEASRGGVRSQQILGYKGQKQGLFIAEFTGKDEDITINYWDHRDWKWIETKDLVKTVDMYRKEATKIFLDKFKEII